MTQEDLAPPTMYCRRCSYALVGLSENRCPECGQPFDPANRRTFLSHPKSFPWRRRSSTLHPWRP
jgi:predicted amidophosphoribosyltransferase